MYNQNNIFSLFSCYSVSSLENLEELDLSDNQLLLRIPVGISKLDKLKSVAFKGCTSMKSPPHVLSRQGISALRKYLTDLAQTGKKNFIPVTVIGQSMAGKTSLIRSMKDTKRVLSNRSSSNNQLDEATKVFKVSEAEFDEGTKLVFHDFGGQAIYHFAYPLSSRSQIIPMLVINIEAFDKLAEANGVDSACEEVCFDWLSHLYLSCPQAGQPLVVLTHRDCVTSNVFKVRKKQLVDATERLRLRIIKEEKAMAPRTSPFFSMVSFCDEAHPLLTKHKPVVFYKGSGKNVIFNIKQMLVSIGLPSLSEIPGSWYVLMDDIGGKSDKPYLTLDEIDSLFPDDKDHVALQYLHDIGRVMWYRNRTLIACIVFHRIELLTKVVELLFDHTSKEVWERRIEGFQPFWHNNQSITKVIYEQMVRNFQESGIMTSVLLSHIIEGESVINPELAIEVLKVFHLICGPIRESSGCSYIVPYFSQKYITVIEGGSYIPLKADICFNGLAIPGYVYHLLTAIYVDIHISKYNNVDVGKNGACVIDIDGTMKYFFHNQAESTVSLIVLTKPSNIHSSWASQLSTLVRLKEQLAEVWKGAHYDTVFYCSHCLLSKQKELSTHANLSWSKTEEHPVYTGKEVVVCRQAKLLQGEPSIPLPLLYPCESIVILNSF